MKKILITGANSYIGTSFEKYLAQWPDQYQVDTVDMIGDDWRQVDFSGYNAVFHVAGIVHIKEREENAPLYFRVNRDLAIEVAKKAKQDRVQQFVFLSSMSVYGVSEGAISMQTPTVPQNYYGKSKLEAEQGLSELVSDSFAVAILRPPMVYGEGCKGNYQSLVKIAKIVPIFPDYPNQRSMLHVDKLLEYIKQLVDTGEGGLHLPQDDAYVCTAKMVQSIGADMGRKIVLTKLLNPFVFLLVKFTALGKKAFGNLYYER